MVNMTQENGTEMLVLRGISSMATRPLLAALAAAWEAESGTAVDMESVGGVDAARRVDGGEAFDVVVLASDAMARLLESGRLIEDSLRPVAVSDMAVALPAGADPSSVATQAALVATLRAAPAIGHSTGPSGKALLMLLEGWGLREALRSRLVEAPPGTPVGGMVASGRVAVGFQQRSELVHSPGITVAPMPPGAQIATVFSAGICRGAGHAPAARRFIDYLVSPAVDTIRRREGLSAP